MNTATTDKKPRLTTSAMIASIAAEGQRVKAAPFGKALVDCAATERTAVLDTIAWPAKAPPDLTHGVAFFNRFRETTGIEWYYANIYKNLDDTDDETLLNWWLEQ